MSRSTDPGHFFQTDASEATRARRLAKSTNKAGNPLKLQSKILAVIADPSTTSSVYLAESAGCVRRVDLKTRDVKTVYRGPSAPVTSIAIGGNNGDTIFAGCWDKDIWSWNRESKAEGRRLKGHSDFVKTIVSAKLGSRDILVSGGADSKIIVWDAVTAEKLYTLRDAQDTMRALQCLVIDPIDTSPTTITLFSSSSDPCIRRWQITADSWSQLTIEQKATERSTSEVIIAHETSVYSMTFSSDTDAEDSDLWTSSADGTAKCLSRTRRWEVQETLEHGDYVRAIAVAGNYVITAGRSEDVKVWDTTSGKLSAFLEGHFEEVTGLLVLDGDDGERLVSVSIDGTVRTWSLDQKSLDVVRRDRAEKEKGIVKEEIVEKKVERKSLLTAEEEAELAELMDDSD